MRVYFNLSKCFLLISLISIPFFIQGTGISISKKNLSEFVKPAYPLPAEDAAIAEAELLNDSLHLDSKGLDKKALEYALKGYNYLQKKGLLPNKDILSICDFSQSSRNKRLYIIDVENKKLLLNTYVAHGKNSGAEYARSFSNNPESLKSSLGFYRTNSTYFGTHGLSLKIEGLERGFNDKADKRNIVMHGSEYVGTNFLRYNGSCGRSFGCPAVPSPESRIVINTIKNGSCLFIYHPTAKYIKHSKILNS